MTTQYSDRARDAANDAIETTMGVSPTLEIRTGAPPANCAAADTGTLLSSMVLPADYWTASAAGVKNLQGLWRDDAADADGQAGHYRIKGTGGVVDMQGTVTETGGGGDLEIQNADIKTGQQVTVTAMTQNMGGG